jgi:hypothetical protein
MWIIWDGRLLHYGLAGRSQNVLFNLYLIATKIEYKKINIFYSNPLPDLRPDLETSGYSAFTYMFGFPKFQITSELWCLVVWSAQGLDYHSLSELLVSTFCIFERFDWAPRNQNCKTDMELQIKIFKLLCQT